ncbi:RNA/RNP complex-1-interacting phosphatase isoform X2 [Anthonomus grandis grandis]|uniref:RNA/RNP complex-1-interacting phosphatase isoform X2 n=1 Tax=Anthonomus grandis grandis TaxID=2921223 RepID=UPI002165BBFC|nr:RNA/RNP complex-1-interacting phosphatase isoform X2 [Anthonomus grandis grandis]
MVRKMIPLVPSMFYMAPKIFYDLFVFRPSCDKKFCWSNKLKEEEWFTPEKLLEQQPNLKTVIDLTNTHRYYNAEEEFGAKGIDHIKILVEGRGSIPANWQIQRFFEAVDTHMQKYSDITDALVGVHCTHGLNRTGYFICRYLVDRLKFEPQEAINRFNQARGHDIERETLLTDIKLKKRPKANNFLPPVTPLPPQNNYRSPLENDLYDEDYNDRYNRRRNDNRWHRNGRNSRPTRSDLDTNWRNRDGENSRESDRRWNRSKHRRPRDRSPIDKVS